MNEYIYISISPSRTTEVYKQIVGDIQMSRHR